MSDNPRMQAALSYAQVCWRVMPLYWIMDYDDRLGCSCRKGLSCPSAGKHPLVSDWTKVATTDPRQIKEWWTTYPLANIGIATGSDSGIVVLDVDPKSGGNQTIKEITLQFGAIPTQLVVETGSGGHHYYFQHPGGYVGNTQGSKTQASPIGMGLDFRGDGGMVVAPPSVHLLGATYRWTQNTAIGQIPDWLAARLKTHASSPPPAKDRQPILVSDDEIIPEGQRHHTLLAWAGSMRQKGFGYAAILAALSHENQTRFARPKEQNEIDRLVAWICKFPAGEVPGLPFLTRVLPEQRIADPDADLPPARMTGLVGVDDYSAELDHLYTNGAQRGLSTGIECLDELYSLKPGDLTILLAAPSSGKTTLMNTIAANVATLHGWKVVICSTENRVENLMADLASMLVGQTYYGNFPEHRMPAEQQAWAHGFLQQHIRFVVPRSDVALTLPWVCNEAVQWGANMLTIDPWGAIELAGDKTANDSKLIRNTLHGYLQPYLKENKLHCLLSVHTTKLTLDAMGDIRMPNPYDATDSAGFYNAADGLIAIRRPKSKGGNITQGEVQKVRDRFTGTLGEFEMSFDFRTSRYYPLDSTSVPF